MKAVDLIVAIKTSVAQAHKAEPRPENVDARARCFIATLSGSLFLHDKNLAESLFSLLSQKESLFSLLSPKETDEPK